MFLEMHCTVGTSILNTLSDCCKVFCVMSWHRQGCDSVQQSEELRGSHHLAPSLKNKSVLEMQGNGEEVKMADLKSNIFMKDEDKFPPGNYYNVRAGRQVMRGG
jgi:hypothetical protein